MSTLRHALVLKLAVAAILAVLPAAAQQAAQPERSVATYGNWELRCETAQRDGAPVESCEIAQAIQIQGQAQPLTQIAIGRPSADAGFRMVLQLPVGVWLPTAPRVALSESAVYPATFKRCVPTACLADLAVDDAMIAMLSDETLEQGQLRFAMQEGQDTPVPILPRGFAAALQALKAKLVQ